MVANPTPLNAFLVGVIVFAPGVTFLAALQVIATARAGTGLTALALIIVVVINVLLVWLPIVFHIAVPGVTTRVTSRFTSFLATRGSSIWSQIATRYPRRMSLAM